MKHAFEFYNGIRLLQCPMQRRKKSEKLVLLHYNKEEKKNRFTSSSSGHRSYILFFGVGWFSKQFHLAECLCIVVVLYLLDCELLARQDNVSFINFKM